MAAAIGQGPSLALRQRAGGAVFRFAGTLPPGATLARAGPATRHDAAGLLVTEAANVARWDHFPATGAPRGLLIEDARTNALSRSSEFAVAPWTAGGATVTAGLTGPDGAASAATLSDATGSWASLAQSFAATSGAVCLSLFVRKDAVGKAVRFAVVRLGGGDLCVDTATGEVAVAGSGASAGCADHGGWWRIWMATSAGAASVTLFPACGAGATLGSAAYSGAAQGAIGVFGAQLEAGGMPSSWIATAAGAVTRAADVLTLAWGSLGVPDGAATIRYGFDDGSGQDVTSVVSGGVATVPTDLNRRHLLSARAL
jgi:hypothetical protein